ncbi:MAG: class I SAM-dependent methyltransferase [Candidatus Omnitrophota bacterium]|jgi:ubiquinone/menaquinone biosynthesis C-methylase UbiE
MDKSGITGKTYGFLWTRPDVLKPVEKWHFDRMQDVIDEPIVRGEIGIDVGSGCGFDSFIMARDNPSVRIVSMDISDGVFTEKKITAGLNNIEIVKGSALEIPLNGGIFDFAYSFGVLHHTPEPRKGLAEIARILKKGAPIFLYLYEDHSENFFKYMAIKLIDLLRMLTTRVPKRVLYLLCYAFSPVIYLFFTVPSKILGMFKATEKIAENVPFNFGKGPFSLRGDLYDRFGAPIEHRFGRSELTGLLEEAGFTRTKISRMKDTAGWVCWGHKRK